MIIFGAVSRSATPSIINLAVGPAPGARRHDLQLTGELSVFALGDDMDTNRPDTQFGYMRSDGTFYAAPQVANTDLLLTC